MKRLLYIFIAILALCACDNRPKGVLSRAEMEQVLYDYHLMQGIIEQLPDSEKIAKAQDYINAVFVKHGITEAQFDTSVTYYNRHTKDMAKIYTNLKERFSEETELIQIQTGNNDLNAIFESGDTANIWAGDKMLILNERTLNRTASYSIICDTATHRHDQFTLMFSPMFLKGTNDNGGKTLTVGLGVVYKNGKTIGITRQLSYSTPDRITIKAADDQDIEKVNAFFFYKGSDDSRNACIVKDISLIQMHEAPALADEVLLPDSLDKVEQPAQPMPTDTANTEVSHKDIKHENNIVIETAPAVRKPNSMGPRRRRR